MSSITQKPYSSASSTTLRRFVQGNRRPCRVLEIRHEVQEGRDLSFQRRLEPLDADAVLFQRYPHGARPAAPERLDRPVVAGLFRIDCRTWPDEIGRDEVLQLQRAVADQDLLRRDSVFSSQLLPQRRVARLLAILQHDVWILPDRRVETRPQFFGRERLGRWYPAGKDDLIRHVYEPPLLDQGCLHHRPTRAQAQPLSPVATCGAVHRLPCANPRSASLPGAIIERRCWYLCRVFAKLEGFLASSDLVAYTAIEPFRADGASVHHGY